MTEKKIKETLKLLIPQLGGIDFALLGTANLKLQGMDFNPNDLDFLVDDTGINKISKLFKSKITKNSGYLEICFIIDKIEVHFVSNILNNMRPANFIEHIIIVEKYNLKIPCMSLQSELEAYEKMGRNKDKEKTIALKKKLNFKIN